MVCVFSCLQSSLLDVITHGLRARRKDLWLWSHFLISQPVRAHKMARTIFCFQTVAIYWKRHVISQRYHQHLRF